MQKLEQQNIEQKYFLAKLQKYLEDEFRWVGPTNHSLTKVKGLRGPLILKRSKSEIYVRGSKELPGNYGYYHLVKRNYDAIINGQKVFFAIVYGDPGTTFVLNKNELKEIFGRYEPTIPKNRPPRWHFDIQKTGTQYYLRVHKKGKKEWEQDRKQKIKEQDYPINPHLNKWNKIEDFRSSYVFERVKHAIEELSIPPEPRRKLIRQLEIAIRNPKFRKNVLQAYKNGCAICGIQLNLVEAAHIVPVNDEGTDEITNGIALCLNHHRAFDQGLISLNSEYKIISNTIKVNELYKRNTSSGWKNLKNR